VSSTADRDLWNAAANRYAEVVTGPDDSFYRSLAPFLRQRLGDVAGRRLLDLGCGHGWLAEELREAGADVTGVDGSSALVERARRTYPGIEFVVHDLTDGLPRPLGSIDAIVSHMVLMDLPALDALITDVRAALAPDGVFVFLDPASLLLRAGSGQKTRSANDFARSPGWGSAGQRRTGP